MGGDQDIGKGQQPSEFVVLQHLAGEIFKKDAFLFFVNVEPDPAEVTALQRLDKRLRIDSAPRLTLTMIVPGFITSIFRD